MDKAAFAELIARVVEQLEGRALDVALATHLNETVAPGETLFDAIEAACHSAVEAGWMCKHEAGGIRYGRVLRPDPALGGFSVDVVRMQDCVGPHHSHPRGEIDYCVAVEGSPTFDERAPGWVVFPPDSVHVPTVAGGEMLIVYLLPEGAMEFLEG